jgi:glycosyltransferase involved in cell wall biosynthesis
MLTYKSATQSGITGIAQHFELPMIATNVGGLGETIRHTKTGFVCDEQSAQSIAIWVEKYFDEARKEPMSHELRTINRSNSWEEFARKLVEFYKEL